MAVLDRLAALSERKQAIIESLKRDTTARVDAIIGELLDLLEEYLKGTELSLAELASTAQLSDLIEIVREAGSGTIGEDMADRIAELTDTIVEQLQAAGLSEGAFTLDERALQAFVDFQVRDVTDSFEQAAAKSIQKAWVNSTFTGQPLKQAIAQATADVAAQLKTSTPAQIETQVGTAISSIDRAITAPVQADRSDIVYVYIGPSDDIVRKSCRHLVGKWVTAEQMAELDNGQIANVAVTGGGYNCRHSWARIKRSVAEKQGVPQATEADIRAFNSEARSGRR